MSEFNARKNLLLSQLTYAKNNSPYYQSILKDQKIDIDTLEDVYRNLPILGKSDISNRENEFLSIPKTNVAEIVTTSGTTGHPVSVYLSNNDLSRLAENENFSYDIIGIDQKDIIQISTTLDKLFMAGLAYYSGAIEKGATVMRVGPGNPEYQWNNIIKHRVTTLVAVPSFVKYMIDYAKENDVEYQNTSVRKILCIGEPIRNNDFKLNSLAQFISNEWNVDLFSTYASTEMATAFTECQTGNGVHANEELIFAEVIDENGQPVAEGEVGEVVVTPLQVEAMPLLKYATGDLCKVYYKQCSCGYKSLRLGPIIGRKNQLLKIKGTSIFPNSLIEVLNKIEGLDTFVIVADQDQYGNDSVSALIPEGVKKNNDLIKQIKRSFKANLRVVPELVFEKKEKIITSQENNNFRKKVKFIDNRKF